jgi:hypothetical protein
LETKKYMQKFRVMGVLGAVVMASGITSALYCSADLGVYLFVDDWEKALAD